MLGVIEGVSEALNYGARMFLGIASDRLGLRKPLVALGYGLSTFLKPLFALARAWGDAFAVRAGDRLGKGIITSPRDALLSDSTTQMQVGKAFGVHSSLDQTGAILGPILASLLFPLVGTRGIFLLSMIPGLASLLVLLLLVEEISVTPRKVTVLQNFRDIPHGPFLKLLLVLGTFSVGAYSYAFILVRAADLGVDPGMIPLAYALLNVAHTSAGIPFGTLSDRVGKEPVLAIAYAISFLTAMLGVFLEGEALYGFILAIAFGLYFGITETVQRAIMPRYAPSELRGTAYGIYNIVSASAS